MKINKKYVVNELRKIRVNACYGNISWVYDDALNIVGGVIFLKFGQKQYFRVENDEVRLIFDYHELLKFV